MEKAKEVVNGIRRKLELPKVHRGKSGIIHETPLLLRRGKKRIIVDFAKNEFELLALKVKAFDLGVDEVLVVMPDTKYKKFAIQLGFRFLRPDELEDELRRLGY